MPTVLLWVIRAVGGVLLARAVRRASQQVNAELRDREAGTFGEPAREAIPTLKRDPKTGVYRPM